MEFSRLRNKLGFNFILYDWGVGHTFHVVCTRLALHMGTLEHVASVTCLRSNRVHLGQSVQQNQYFFSASRR